MRQLVLACFCLCLASCGGNKYGDHPPFPTSGQILVNGQPAKQANVIFHHIEKWGDRSIVPQAWTDDEGRFVLSTYDVDDGAPAGDYQVVVIWPAYRLKTMGPDKLGGKYAKAETSGLKAHIDPGKNELPPFQLQATLTEPKPGELGEGKGKRKAEKKR